MLLPIYVPEARSGDADEILESASSVFISDLTIAEFHVSLARRLKLGTLEPSHVSLIRQAFEEHLVHDVLQRRPLQLAHSEEAGRLARESAVLLRTLDALHIAVAVDVGATLGTFDRRMADAARSLGIAVRD